MFFVSRYVRYDYVAVILFINVILFIYNIFVVLNFVADCLFSIECPVQNMFLRTFC